ncbi:MAG: large repetitive protein, partial [Actinomycetota bacterium]|nr:large repetitive protein [Actinomycetota bacterium]
TQTIGAADMDGKNVNYSFIQTTGVAGGITSLAADSSGIYWSDGDGTGQVMSADLNGQNIDATYLPANVTAYSDTTYDDSGGEIDHDVMTKHVSISNGQIYWAGSGIENTYLGSATIGASGPTNIVYPLQTFADGGTAQLTANAQRLYWWSPNQNGGNSTGMSTVGGVTINPSIMTDTGAPVVSPSALSAPPQVTTVSPVGGSTLGGTLVTISGTGFQQTTDTVTIGGVPCANVTASSPTSLTCTTGVHTAGPIDYGPADVTVTNPDTQSGTLTGGFDYSPPTPTIGAVNPGSALFLGGQQIAINGAGFDPNLTVMLGNTPCSIAPGNVTPTTITCTPGNNQVEQVVDVVVNNGDGKLATKARGFTFAGYAPTAAPQSPLTPTTAPLNGGTILTITGGYFDQNAQITVGGSPCPQISGGSGQGSPNSTLLCQLPAGTAVGPATVVVANPDGQRISLPGADSTATFSYGPPNPSISSVTTAAGESFGSTGGNYRVTVAGTSFGQNPSVMVGAQPCVNPVLAGSTVSCRVRPHSAGPVDVVVTRADGQSAVLTRGFTFVVETPTLTSISPAAGSSTGGTPVTVSGTGFDPAATVSLGGAICGQVQVTGQASLSCVTGGDMVGPADLVVTNPGDLSATLPGAFTYGGWGPGPSPQPLSITPSAGTPGGGESVTISGNFLGVVPTDVTVTIGGVGCQVTTTTGSSLNCTTGPHPLGVGDVVVTAVVNLATGTLPQSFTYATVVPPTVTSISPSEGTFLGRTPVTITGTGFMAGADVKIGTAICRNPQVTSPTTVTCTTGRSQLSPDSSALAAKVVVTNSDQQASTDPVTYRYTPGGNLFWPNGGASPQSIGQAAVGNTGTDHSYTLPSGVGMLGGIAADDRYVYWADQLNASIGRVPIDDLAGEQAQPKWIDLSSVSATPMSVSVSGGYIYWADSSNDQIGRATLANPGSTVAYNFVSGNALNSPYGVAVDNAYIYWANHGDSTLARAYLANGSLPTAIHTVSNGHNPSGVTVRGGQLYWTAQTAAGTGGSLGRANPDGSNPTDSFVGNTGAGNVASFNSPQGLAAAGSTLFWANSGGTSLGAANLADGSSPDGNLIVGANAPQGVAVN